MRDIFEKGRTIGKRTFASWRGLLSFMSFSVGGPDDGSINGPVDDLLGS